MAITFPLVIIFSFLSFSAFIFAIAEQPFPHDASQKLPELKGKTLSHLHFYWHDTLSGSNLTSITVAKPSTSPSAVFDFGYVNIFDNPITEGPELGSKFLGRSQGFYADSSKDTEPFQVLFSAMSFAFLEGKYNGSTINVLGRNPIVLNKVREIPVIGGSGLFRFAEGFAELRTHWFNAGTKDAVVEFNVYVWHY